MRVIIDHRGIRLIPQDYLERKYIEQNPSVLLVSTPRDYNGSPSYIYEEKKSNDQK